MDKVVDEYPEFNSRLLQVQLATYETAQMLLALFGKWCQRRRRGQTAMSAVGPSPPVPMTASPTSLDEAWQQDSRTTGYEHTADSGLMVLLF
ncbi:hypothetical protein NHX12_005839 [Muraenolepis orangiensis]|uniref:Uncharacterized protein n=1 Tax=Muraenolepis orangiensis TaxID=630683 RepID=A0A9Q0DRE0_9TELE|nr:hypothetical protein NHX12_005839 [Muraenolepis orangiensis]